MDMHNTYDALVRDRCLDILEGYNVEPQYRHILHAYWDRLRMVARAGVYYGAFLRGFWGATQWDPMFPTIFNVVVHAVVCHWI